MELGIVLRQSYPGLGALATNSTGVSHVKVSLHVSLHCLLVVCSLFAGQASELHPIFCTSANH